MNLSNKDKDLEEVAKAILEGEEVEQIDEANKIHAWTNAGKSGKEYAEVTQFVGPADLGYGMIGSRKMVQISVGKQYIELNARDLEVLMKSLKKLKL